MAIDDLQDRLSDQAGRVGTTVTAAVDGIRDRTADLVRADGGSVFREFHRLGARVDAAEERLHTHLEDSADTLDSQLEALLSASKRTTWPRRLVWLTFGATLGAGAAYLADPDRGKARRSQLTDQVAARSRSVADELGNQAKGAVKQAAGGVVEQVKDALPERAEADAALLQQRIKSEVLGKRDDAAAIVVRVDAPGAVALKGTIATSEAERELLAEVAGVDGVTEVISELTVTAS